MKRLNILDAIIIIAIMLGIGFGAYRLSAGGGGSPVMVTYTAELSQVEKAVAQQISVGDEVFISNKEKDTGVVTNVDVTDSQVIAYNSQDGLYAMETNPLKADAIVELQSKAVERDSEIVTGKTQIKVGLPVYLKGKGYSGMGYIISMEVTEDVD